MRKKLKAWMFAGIRAAVQGAWTAALAAGLLDRLNPAIRDYLGSQIPAVGVALAGAAYGLVVATIRWLETRTGMSTGARFARGLAAFIMLGSSAYQPVYAPSSPNTKATAVLTQTIPGKVTIPGEASLTIPVRTLRE